MWFCLQMEGVPKHRPDGKMIRKETQLFGVASFEKTNLIITKTVDDNH